MHSGAVLSSSTLSNTCGALLLPPPIYNSAAITVIDDEGPPLALGFLQPVLSGFVYIIFVICSFCAWDQPVCVQLLLAVAMSLRLQYTWTNWHYLM